MFLARTDDEKATADRAYSDRMDLESLRPLRATSPTEAIALWDAGLPQPTPSMQGASIIPRALATDEDGAPRAAVAETAAERKRRLTMEAASAKAVRLAQERAAQRAKSTAKASEVALERLSEQTEQRTKSQAKAAEVAQERLAEAEKESAEEMRTKLLAFAPVAGALLLGVAVIGIAVYLARKG